MVKRPEAYAWSSARASLQGTQDPVLTPNPRDLDLGKTAPDRQRCYPQFLEEQLCQPVPASDTAPVGSAPYLRQLAASTAGGPLPLKRRGRPRKTATQSRHEK